MIIYDATKKDFMDHVTNDEIVTKIYELYRQKVGRAKRSEIQAWNNSMLQICTRF